MKIFIVFFVTVFLTGCASTDPREGGLFGGIKGIQSGAYKKQLKDRQNKVNSLNSSSSRLAAEGQQLDREIAIASRKNRSNQSQLAALNKGISKKERASKNLSTQQRENSAKLAKLKKQRKSIDKEIKILSKKSHSSGSSDVALQRKLKILRQERDLLSRSIHRM